LWTVIYEECWIFSSFAHVKSTEIKRALLTASFFEND
jgi:hypothetical protein